MVIKKALPRAPVVLSAEERRCVIQFVGILVEVDQRASAPDFAQVATTGRRVATKGKCVSADKRKPSNKKDTGLKNQIIRKVRNFYGPYFFSNYFKFVPEANKDFKSLFLFI